MTPAVSNPRQAKPVVCIKIDKDYISHGEWASDASREWSAVPGLDYDNTYTGHPVPEGPKVRFRLLDDDGEVYYGGWLLNDDHCFNQLLVLSWGMGIGCTEIQVKQNEGWITEIG